LRFVTIDAAFVSIVFPDGVVVVVEDVVGGVVAVAEGAVDVEFTVLFCGPVGVVCNNLGTATRAPPIIAIAKTAITMPEISPTLDLGWTGTGLAKGGAPVP